MWSIGEILGGIGVISAVGGVFVTLTNTRRDIKSNADRIAAVELTEANCPITKVEVNVGKIETEVGWLKLILSSDTKSRRKDLWEHHSPLKLTIAAISLIPTDIKQVIDETPGTYEKIYKRVYSMPSLQESDLVQLSRDKGLSVMELACIIDDYIRQKVNGGNYGLGN